MWQYHSMALMLRLEALQQLRVGWGLSEFTEFLYCERGHLLTQNVVLQVEGDFRDPSAHFIGFTTSIDTQEFCVTRGHQNIYILYLNTQHILFVVLWNIYC